MEDSPKTSSSNFILIIIFLSLIHASIHIPFLITNYFGEQDAAVIANDAIRAFIHGHDTIFGTPLFSTPLYSNVLDFLLKFHFISFSNIAFFMSVLSYVASAIITIAMFIFVFKLTRSIGAGFLASLILQLVPVFWFNSIYGFPSIVALAFLMVSIVFFQTAFHNFLSGKGYILILLAFILYVLAVLTKVDIVLASPIYCLPVWQSSLGIKKKIIWTSCLALCSVFVFYLFNQYSAALLALDNKSLLNLEEWGAWNTQFHPDISSLFLRANFRVITKAVGIFSLPVAIIAILLVWWRRELRINVIWLFLSAMPTVLFWGMRAASGGNSARHNLLPAVLLCVVLVLPLCMKFWLKWAWLTVLSVLCIANYFYFPATDSSVYTSGRVMASSELLEQKVKTYHSLGQRVARLPYKKIAVVGKGWMQTYFQFEVLRSKELSYIGHDWVEMDGQKIYTFEMKGIDGERLFYWVTRKPEMTTIDALADRGLFLVICDKKVLEYVLAKRRFNGKYLFLISQPELAKLK